MSSTQFLTPINPVKMAMTSSMLPSFEVLHGFIYDVLKPILPQQPYLSRTIRDALSLALGYKSYSDLVDSARRNTAMSNEPELNVFSFKKHEDAVWLCVCHLAEKLWPHKKEVGVTELDDLHSILANDFFSFQVQDGHAMTLSLTLKNREIIGAGYIGGLYETDDKTVFIRQLLQLYHRSQEWGYSPGLSFEYVSALSEWVVIACDQDLLHKIQLVNDDFLENKLNETREDVRLTYIDTKFNQIMSKMDIPYDVLNYRDFSFKTHFAQPTSRGVIIPCTYLIPE
ncbi:hypothetical protein AB7254_17010 [Providencia rettgeri]